MMTTCDPRCGTTDAGGTTFYCSGECFTAALRDAGREQEGVCAECGKAVGRFSTICASCPDATAKGR
jgi:hypothetical protein